MNRLSNCLLAVICLYMMAGGVAVAQQETIYRFAPGQDGNWQAPNRFHRFSVQIGADRISLHDPSGLDGSPVLTLDFVAVSAGSHRQVPGIPRVAVSGSRVERFFDGFSDWYINDRKGLKQGFTIGARPTGDSTGLLTLHFAIGGSLSAFPAPDGSSVVFRNSTGRAIYHYGELVVFDATGQVLPSYFDFENGRLAIRVDDAEAVYPITVDPLLTSSSWSLDGNKSGGSFGEAVATAGDVNGDGFSDLLVGAPGWADAQTGEGRVYLYLGSSAGLSSTPAWSVDADQAGAALGTAVSTAGDVNGDGYDDFLVSAPGYDGAFADEGRVFLYLGSATGPSVTADWSADGGQSGSDFGAALSFAGDVDGDGYDDVLIGAPGHDGTWVDEGRAHLFPGSATGPAASASWTADGGQTGAAWGATVAGAGDLNGDGFADLAVGSPLFDAPAVDAGQIAVFLGSLGGPAAVADWTVNGDQAGGRLGDGLASIGDSDGDGYADLAAAAPLYDTPVVNAGRVYLFSGGSAVPFGPASWTADGSQTAEQFGSSLAAAGDTNGDGYADLAIGAPAYDAVGTGEGRAVLYEGSGAGLQALPAWNSIGDQDGAAFGTAVTSAGDVNGDGFGDLAVGAPLYDVVTGNNEGNAVVYLGTAGLVATSPDWNVQPHKTNNEFAIEVDMAGDVNGDGYTDLIIGSPWFNTGLTEMGRVLIYHGSPNGPPATESWVVWGTQEEQDFGHSVSHAGDVNGDGYDDVIIGSPFYDNPELDEGRAFLFLGSPTGVELTPSWSYDSNQAGGEFGFSVSNAGDVNGDGFADVLVGAPGFDNGVSNSGRAYLFLGSPSGLSTVPNWSYQATADTEQFGYSVSLAGDVNADGYGDIIIGARRAPGNGRAYVFHGSPTGPSLVPDWSKGDIGGQFGVHVDTAGDVNGDSFSDVVVGAYQYNNEGKAFVFHGSAAGLSTTEAWSATGGQAGSQFGVAVSAAGDINHDGFSDIVIGSKKYDNPEIDEGRAYVYLGSATGLAAGPAWTLEIDSAGANLGNSVSEAGDVNGDGFDDLLVAADQWTNLAINEGRADLFYGGASNGLSRLPRQARSDDSAPISLGGRSDSQSGFRLKALGRTPAGRDRIRFVWEIEPIGTPFDGLGLSESLTMETAAPTASGSFVPFNEPISGLNPVTAYHWRVRIVSDNPLFPRSPWLTMPGNTIAELELRTDGCTDNDGDGYGATGHASCPQGATPDCDDTNAAVYPGATEVCDGVNNDCSDPGWPDTTGGIDENLDGDNYSTCQGDCEDTDPTINPGATEITCDSIDQNCNGIADDTPDTDGDTFTVCTDCDDANAAVYPGAAEVCDGVNNDCDDPSWPGTTGGIEEDLDTDNYSVCQGDCVDTNPAINPGAAEIFCDTIDQNCNGLADDSPDVDGDTYSVCDGDCNDTNPAINPGATEITCDLEDQNCNGDIDEDPDADIDGYGRCSGDCDDADPAINPGAAEIFCDSIDQNCNGFEDDAPLTDTDGDTYTYCLDCDDTDPAINPGAAEITCNGIDENCNGPADDTRDLDDDTYSVCVDCDDTDPAINPGAAEITCNGIDDNCNGADDEAPDVDGDTYGLCSGDCDDSDPAINPGAAELTCNGIDENCNGTADDAPDVDGDTYSICTGDCNDTDPAVHPGMVEITCNAVDDNCNGLTDDTPDGDGDTYSICVDCDDTNPLINPAGSEITCNGIDENCNGALDDTPDGDGDTYSECDDCNDADPAINPGATEITCNGIDENCNGAADDTPNVDGDAYTICDGDCDDTNPAINPGVTEITCNGIDENCSGPADDEPDADGDTYSTCVDCDDANPAINPGATEIACNSTDENCNGALDDEPDTDGDTYSDCIDCDITDPAINPGATEITCNGIDENCTGPVDDEPDVDGDTFSVCNDCDDTDPLINPGATEITCNAIDENCNGALDDEPDVDGDTFSACVDCDDTDPAINPAATEITCNAIDENCNGAADDTPDVDGDTFTVCAGDCDDTDPAINPGAAEITCNAIDENCNGALDDEPDTDADTYSDCIDCDINDPAINPGATEITCNAIDENCNGALDDEPDTDADTYSDCIDCDINDPAINPGATEITCNGIDENCNGPADDTPD
ncbi:MAG: FG-GAP repeat protein, partial [Acidobacteria bacterium]|nr:FG-GAP repeat protein [Candidatus Polarisedimenticola svalbardensis]